MEIFNLILIFIVVGLLVLTSGVKYFSKHNSEEDFLHNIKVDMYIVGKDYFIGFEYGEIAEMWELFFGKEKPMPSLEKATSLMVYNSQAYCNEKGMGLH